MNRSFLTKGLFALPPGLRSLVNDVSIDTVDELPMESRLDSESFERYYDENSHISPEDETQPRYDYSEF